jgi:hypothetical protein
MAGVVPAGGEGKHALILNFQFSTYNLERKLEIGKFDLSDCASVACVWSDIHPLDGGFALGKSLRMKV